MTKDQEIVAKENRYHRLSERGDKNIKQPGVLRRLRREIRNLKK